MSLVTTLPNLNGARLIIVDEDTEANHAESLVTSWLPLLKSKENRNVHLFLFSKGKTSSKIHQNWKEDDHLKIHDYYTIDLYKTDPFDEAKLSLISDLNSLDQNSAVIIDSLSSLLVNKGLSETCKFVEKLSSKVSQLICIYQRDFTPRKIPSVKTLGTSYVRLEPTRGLKLEQNLSYRTLTLHCKPGGGILQQEEIVEQNIASYEIRTEKVAIKNSQKLESIGVEPSGKIQASFRIEMNDREMEQRNATPLPYILNSLPISESKIHYEPDEVDDLDEEDPDDDLDF